MNFFKSVFNVLTIIVLVVPFLSCQTIQDNPKETGGTLLGAGLGALIGSNVGSGKGQLTAVALGALVGAWAGSEVGKSLDRADRAFAEKNAQESLEYAKLGQKQAWSNPDSGNSGTFTPTRTYKIENNQDCREFITTIYVSGKEETATGRACRNKDGTWKIVQ
jgi:surface antigen